MFAGNKIPFVDENSKIENVIKLINLKRLGVAIVRNKKKGGMMQQASPNQVFTPPSVSAREFKRESIPPTEDYREHLLELEKEGELEVQRVPEPYVEVETKFGRIKKIPIVDMSA